MRKKNIFLAAVLSAAMVSSSVMPVFAESLTDGETAVMEMAEETEEAETEPMEEAPEAEQESVLAEIPDELSMEETEELPREEAGKLENAADVLLEAPGELIEDNKSTEDSEYIKEVIAQGSDFSANVPSSTSEVLYGAGREATIYYTASKIYKGGEFKGVQVDQYMDLEQTPENHWVTFRWHYKGEKWEVLQYSKKTDKLEHVNISGDAYYNVWPEMFWLLRARGGYGYAMTGYLIDTELAMWDYTYTAEDVKKDLYRVDWSDIPNNLPDAFYKGACAQVDRYHGIRTINGDTYYLKRNGTMARNEKVIEGKKAYLFGSDCKCYKSYVPIEEKWVKKPDGYYWLQDDNTILREGGWHELGGRKYFLAYKSGRRKSGWQTWNGNTYYLSPRTGVLMTGFVNIEKNWYFFQRQTGEMVKGWKTYMGNRYYLDEKTGIRKQGMLTLNGKKYYFESNGSQHFGWRSIGGKKYFFDCKTGEMKQNTWILDGKYKYYANKDGSRFSGIRSIKGKNYYFQPDGRLVTNKKGYKINGKKYNIDKNGVLTMVK